MHCKAERKSNKFTFAADIGKAVAGIGEIKESRPGASMLEIKDLDFLTEEADVEEAVTKVLNCSNKNKRSECLSQIR